MGDAADDAFFAACDDEEEWFYIRRWQIEKGCNHTLYQDDDGLISCDICNIVADV